VVNEAGEIEVRDILPLRWTSTSAVPTVLLGRKPEPGEGLRDEPEALMRAGPPAERPFSPEGTRKPRQRGGVEAVAD
jgi:hypothetical protein